MNIIKELFDSLFDKLASISRKRSQNEYDDLMDEVRKVRRELMNELDSVKNLATGRFIRDDGRLILSAPEIIIGNVDEYGTLLDGHSAVTLRGKNLNLHGVSEEGSINARANVIDAVSEDPGIDGSSHVAYPGSKMRMLAREISISAEEPLFYDTNPISDGYFISSLSPNGGQGVTISSDSHINISAQTSVDRRRDQVNESLTRYRECRASLQTSSANVTQKVADSQIKFLTAYNSRIVNEFDARTSYWAIDQMYDAFIASSAEFCHALYDYYIVSANQHENERIISCLQSEMNRLNALNATFKTASTNTSVNISSEIVNVASVDGDNNVRSNKEAGVNINARRINATTFNQDNSLFAAEDSGILLCSNSIDLYAVKQVAKNSEVNSTPTGSISLWSKDISMDTSGWKQKDSQPAERTGLAADSQISMCSSNVRVASLNEKNEAVGKVSVNAKNISLRSMNLDENGKNAKLCKDGKISVKSELFSVTSDKDKTPSQVQVHATKGFRISTDDFQLTNQKEDSQFVLADKKLLIHTADKTAISNIVQIPDLTTDELTTDTITVSNIDVKSSLKSSTINDGTKTPKRPKVDKEKIGKLLDLISVDDSDLYVADKKSKKK